MISLRNIVNDLGATSAAIMTPNSNGQHLYCYGSYNMPSEWIALINQFDTYTNVGNVHVYKTGRPVINNGFSNDFHGHYIESVLIVPIKKEDTTIATLEVIQSQKGKSFTEEDLVKAEGFSKQIEIKL